MSVKLGRVIFKRIGGRVIPIRIGAEAKTLAAGIKGVSSKALKRLNLLQKQGMAKLKSGKIVSTEEASSSEKMIAFVKKTGAIRFNKSGDSINLDYFSKLTSEQKTTLAMKADKIGAVYVDANKKGSGSFNSLKEFIRSPLNWAQTDFKPSKLSLELQEKSIKELGLTDDIDEAGFIFRDGKMLDLSGKKQGGPAGVRYLDHREISELVKISPKRKTGYELKRDLKLAQQIRKLSKRQGR